MGAHAGRIAPDRRWLRRGDRGRLGSQGLLRRGRLCQLRDVRQLHPIGLTFLPNQRLTRDLTTRQAGCDVCLGQRPHLLALHDDVPCALSLGGRGLGLRGSSGRAFTAASDHNDVVALLASDFEGLTLDLFVRYRVLSLTSVTDDFHWALI